MDSSAYNNFYRIDEFSESCISHLMENNELIWRLLYYNTPNAYSEANLTHVQKASLIYAGQADSSQYNVFMDGGTPDVVTREDCILRIVPYRMRADNHVVGTMSMSFEVYCHYKVNTLSNYKTRVDVITRELLQEFNGFDIGGIGKLSINNFANQTDKMAILGQLPFKGKQIIMSTKVA